MNNKQLKKFESKYPILLIGVLIGIFTFHFIYAGNFTKEASLYGRAKGDKLLLILIDFDSFSCMPCMEPFFNFYRELPPFVQEENIWGILVFKSPGLIEDKDIYQRIVEKKLRGFVKANMIKFPIFMDNFQIFNEATKEGTAIILLDRNQRMIKRYSFPLDQKQINEIVHQIIN